MLPFQRTLPTRHRNDLRWWHRGRSRYAVWTLEIKDEDILARVRAAREHLSNFLLAPYCRQPHITVFVCGFLTDRFKWDDDYTPHRRMQHLQDLTAAPLAPFELTIGGIGTFASAPFLRVMDTQGGLEKLRDILSRTHSKIRMSPYIPHLTLGLYAGSFDSGLLAGRIMSFPDTHPIRQSVEAVRLTTYASREIAGPLTVYDTVMFQSRSSSTHPAEEHE